MFRMIGNRIELLRYRIDYVDQGEQQVCYAATAEEAERLAQHTGGEISLLPEQEDSWMDGLEVEDLPDTYAQALELQRKGKQAYLEQQKARRIAESKQQLADYLLAHPIQWTDGQYYAITAEKQQQLTSKLMSAALAAQLSQPYTLTWNASGQECQTWTRENLTALAFAMDARVTALVSYQQAQEVAMQQVQTLEELEAIPVNYDSVVIEEKAV